MKTMRRFLSARKCTRSVQNLHFFVVVLFLSLNLWVTVQRQVALLRQLQLQLRRAREEGALAEQRVRDEVSQECTKIFSQMQEDFE